MLRSFVDDLSQTIYAKTISGTTKWAYKAGIKLATGLIGGGNIISDKSVIMASNIAIARTVASKMSSRGIILRIVKHAKDLGVGTTAGRARCTQIVSKRIKAPYSEYKG